MRGTQINPLAGENEEEPRPKARLFSISVADGQLERVLGLIFCQTNQAQSPEDSATAETTAPLVLALSVQLVLAPSSPR